MNFFDNLIILKFNHLCKKYEVRCLRNNIYKTVKVRNYKHLINLWKNNPKNYNVFKNEKDIISYLNKKFAWKNLEYKKYIWIDSYLWLYIGYNKQEVEDFILKETNRFK